MRLTLRTLLAYLDGILEKRDADELAEKIQESEFATKQVHRIRDVTKRIRLGAPKVLGQGTGLDPNTVADYLDNTLPAERAPDFEKVCLESDVHLAEVAACHHVLTMVLGEPAEVEPTTRQRMYNLAKPGESGIGTIPPPPRKGGDGAPPAGPPELAAVGAVNTTRRELEVPDYLRQSTGRRFGPLLATVALLAIAAAVALIVGGEDFRRRLGLAGAPPVSESAQSDTKNPTPVDRSPAPAVIEKVSPTDAAAATQTPKIVEKQPTDDAVSKPAETPEPAEPEPKKEPTPEPKTDTLPKSTPIDPPVPPPPDPALNDAKPTESPLPPGAAIGQYTLADDVLLRYDPKRDYVRLPAPSQLAVGDVLLALPGFRPSIVLNNGASLQLDGGTIVQLVSGADGTPGVHVVYGRVLRWGTTGKTGVACRAIVGQHTATIRFTDPDSAVAIEVYPYFAPGEDPISAPGPTVADVAVIGGQIEWQVEGQEQPTLVKAGLRLTWLGKNPSDAKPAVRILGWDDRRNESDIEQRGIAEVKKSLPPGEPVGLLMRELIEVRRSETRSLAALGIGFLGKYDALLAGLKDESLAWAQWRVKYVGGLRFAILRGPEEATRVREALFKEFGTKPGADLYRMLCGYSPRQLSEGADERLVDFLSHDELPYRVLAFYNLQAITGITHGYKPEGTEIQRRTPTQTWRAWQKTGRIMYKDTVPPKNGDSATGKAATNNAGVKPEAKESVTQ
jgi:hypothetical protein